MDNFFKSFFNNGPVDFLQEGQQPSAKDLGLQDQQPGGGTPEDQNKPDQQQEQPEQKPTLEDIGAKKNAETRERTKKAWGKTKELAGKTADVARGLASKEGGKLVLDRMDQAKDNLVDKYEGIMDKAATKRDETVDKANAKVNELIDRTKAKLITEPKDKVTAFGRGVKEYFGDKGKNIADRIRANKADRNARYMQDVADRYQRKLDRADRKLTRAQESGRASRIERRQNRKDRMSERTDNFNALANQSRENATRFRSRIQTREAVRKAA